MRSSRSRRILAASVAAALLAALTASAEGERAVPTDWWANRTTVSHVVSFQGQGLRLAAGYTTGFIEGTVTLTSYDPWQIQFAVHADESIDLPSEYVDIFFNGILVERVFNTPPNTLYPIEHWIVGDSFTYRFEFSSPSTTFFDHLHVEPGWVVPEPASLLLVGFGLVALRQMRRRV